MKFAFIIDPIAKLDPGHDSSVALMEAAQELGHQVFITQAQQMGVVAGQAMAYLTPVTLVPVTLGDNRWDAVADWYTLGDTQWQSLNTMDAVFMRTDPPVSDPMAAAARPKATDAAAPAATAAAAAATTTPTRTVMGLSWRW